MDEEQNKEDQNKISLPEGLIIGMIVLSADVIETLIALTGVGIIIGEVINFATGAVIEFWLFMKGIKGFWKLASFGIGVVADGATSSFFPIKTLTFLITIYLINHPKIAKVSSLAKAETTRGKQ